MRAIRIACAQYSLCDIESFEAFVQQVRHSVESAAKDGAEIICFPEYFSTQLLSYGEALSAKRGIARLATEFTQALQELLSGLATQHGLYIIAGSHPILNDRRLENHCLVFTPAGKHFSQPKLHTTPSERDEWGVVEGNSLHIIETPKAKIAVQICYDIEFPQATERLAELGVDLIFVPYCTDDRAGHFRVSHCAQARAIENQIYVATAGLVGRLEHVADMQDQFAQSAVYGPCDTDFPEDGVLVQAEENVGCLLVTELDLDALTRVRQEGSVMPRLARRNDISQIPYSNHG